MKLLATVTGWLYFIAVQLVSLALMVIGWVILLPMAFTHAWAGTPKHWRGGWLTYLYSNDEDGVTGAAWYRAMYGESGWRAYCWSALRNPVGNLRWFVARPQGPFWRGMGGGFYMQAGFRPDHGWPVLSAGKVPDGGFDY